MTDIRSMYKTELKELMERLGQKSFRAGQIFKWLHASMADSYEEMTDLSKALRSEMAEKFPIYGARCVTHLKSSIDGTEKFLFALHDDNVIESVLMRYNHGNSVCISSQVGCKMGCAFCASTLEGCVRDLSASEMLAQVYSIQKISGERVSNVVVMGSGEPLDNYDNLIRFIKLLSDPDGLNISRRSITVSTCGLVPKIIELADEELAITLAVSLHAPNDEKRKALMPVAKKYSMDELLSSCRYYFEKTGRRVTFEYALVEGTNDSREDAKELAKRLSGMNCHVNLIPVNPVEERDCKRPAAEACRAFAGALDKYGVNATVRRELGSDISASCGQLRRSYLN